MCVWANPPCVCEQILRDDRLSPSRLCDAGAAERRQDTCQKHLLSSIEELICRGNHLDGAERQINFKNIPTCVCVV